MLSVNTPYIWLVNDLDLCYDKCFYDIMRGPMPIYGRIIA